MVEDREIRIKRLLYQSWYRGCKETDRILGWFARAHLQGFGDAELDAFEAIMAESDNDIYNWVSGKVPVPEKYQNNTVMQKLLVFDVAEANSPD